MDNLSKALLIAIVGLACPFVVPIFADILADDEEEEAGE